MRLAHSITRRSLAAAIVTLLASTALWASQDTTLPDAPGVEIARAKCLSCHGADMIVGQRLSSAGWGREIDKMVRWGATITPQEREVLQPYLAQHFAPRPAASHAATGSSAEASAKAGAAIFKRVCLTCHEADIVEQQKLTPTGWTRSVEKMMRWGAQVRDAEKQPLVDYLAARFGPR